MEGSRAPIEHAGWCAVAPRASPGWLRAEVLAWLVGRVLRVRRRHVVSSMIRAGVPEPERTADAMYRSLAHGVLSLLARGARARRAARSDAALDAGELEIGAPRGAVLAVAHTGSWDLAACEAAGRIRLAVVTKRLRIRWLDALWQKIRARSGVELLTAGAVVRPALAILERGGHVAMMIDQAPLERRGAVETTFLGGRVLVDVAPALVAMRARVPLVPVFPFRRPDGVSTVRVGRAFVPPARASRRWIETTAVAVTRLLEDFVRAHPEQWLWMHRRWRLPPDHAPRAS